MDSKSIVPLEFDDDYNEVDDIIDNKFLGAQWFMRHVIVMNTHADRTTNLKLIDFRYVSG